VLTSAVTRARADAEAMARAGGGTLGPLLEVSSVPSGPQPVIEMGNLIRARAAEQTPINPGALTVTVSVTARWQFVPGSGGHR
jgi:uncharacterized protein YggE